MKKPSNTRCPPPQHRQAMPRALPMLAALFGACGVALFGAHGAALAQSSGVPKVVLANKQPRYVGPVAASASPQGLTAEFSIGMSPQAALATVAPYFGIADPANELAETRSYRSPRAGVVRRYRQLHYGLPVIGGELVMSTDRTGRFEALSGEVASGLALADLVPQLGAAQAQDLALQAAAKYHGLPPSALVATEPELSIYRAELLGPSSLREDTLVWRLEITAAGEAVNELFLIDAKTGSLALHFNQADFALDRRTYTTNGTSSLPGTLLCDETQPSCTEGVNIDADAAHLYAAQTYDFYLDRHGRDSFDDAGATIVSSVGYGPSAFCPNAFWNGTQVAFCPGVALADDVVVHEITHAVTQYTSGLYYYYQSGAINESFSDVWGELIDQTNNTGNDDPAVRWLLGEDATTLSVIRNMQDPPQFNDPDRVGSALFRTSSGDNGGVHTNSGVNNKAVYLLVDGGTFNGFTIGGIGLDKTAALYYRVQSQHLTSGSDYADLYVALNQACQDMMGTAELDAADCLEVVKATAATEMNREPEARAGTEAAVCPVNQLPNDFYFNGFESIAERTLWSEVDLSGNGNWLFSTQLVTEGAIAAATYGTTTASDYAFEMNASITLPDAAFLHFRHLFNQETSNNGFYDGGIVEISTDDGVTWTDARAYYSAGQDYGGTLSDASGNPQGGRDAFVADSRGYVSTRYDLAALASSTVRIRFRNTSDTGTTTGLAWFIDEVRFYTCDEDLSPNLDPVADAGPDQTVAPLTSVSLSATNSRDDDGTIQSFDWVQLAGPAVTLTASGARLQFVAPATPTQELLEFELTVTDNRGATATDRVTVTVINAPPTADAGPDLAHKPLEVVQLAVIANDPDGNIASYAWTQTSGPAVVLSSYFIASPAFLAPPVVMQAVLEFEVVVTDNAGASVTDQVRVTVTNDQPFADAGADFDLKPEALGALEAITSDPDGQIVSQSWVQISGPPVTIYNPTYPIANFYAPGVVTSAVLEFELTAFDNFGAAATDRVLVTVTNDQPTIQMDPGRTIRPREILVIKGNAFDQDGGIVSYAWTQTAGPAVALINPTFPVDAWFEAPSVPDQAVLTFALTATDRYGATVTGTIDITVVNDPPTSSAGVDADVSAGASVALSGFGTDANGAIVSYRWRQTSGPTVALSTATASSAQFMAPSLPSASVLTFELEVTDNDGATAIDTVTVRVQAKPPESGGGGGSIDWWTLLALLGAALFAPLRGRALRR